jgi:hypothetical protein
MIDAGLLVLELCLERDAYFSHAPHILGKVAHCALTHQPTADPPLQESQCFFLPKDLDLVAERLVGAGERGRREAEVAGVSLVLGVAAVGHNLDQLHANVYGHIGGDASLGVPT